jgi:MHS family shikimate/dehydroshikimate transporter-like MFS transporter
MSSAPAMAPTIRGGRLRSAIAATIGNGFQFYDFFLYATASALIFNTVFFPSSNPALGTMAAFASYAVGFVTRPLGALVFGRIGDRFGRKVTLTWTLALMGVATFSIGLLPTYAQVGVVAPVLLIGLRMLQGFAAGGEWGGGMLMATESAPDGRRGYYGAWSQAGVGVGFIVSAGVLYLSRLLGDHAFLTWGWRLPFLASVIVVAAGMVIRARVPESLEFEQSTERSPDRSPMRRVVQRHWPALLMAAGVLLAEMCGPMLSTTFAVAYGHMAGVSGDLLLTAVILSMAADTFAMLFFGHLSDRIGRIKVYMFGVVSLALFIYPFFRLEVSGSDVACVAGFLIINGVCHAAMIGPQPALLTELFPVSVRASGLALAQSLAVMVVGFTPLAASALFYVTGSILSVVGLTAALCLVSGVALTAASRSLRTL